MDITENTPLISVIVPIYNVERYLRQCVDSIISQTYENLEIILVDDGSTDSSGEICNHYKDCDSRIKVIHKNNGGLSSARNMGLEIATGQYISFVDGDDYIDSSMINELYGIQNKFNADISCCRCYSFFDDVIEKCEFSNQVTVYESKEFIQDLTRKRIKGMSYSVWKFLFLRSSIDGVLFEEGRYFEDVIYLTRVCLRGGKVVFEDAPYYYYRKNPQSITQVMCSNKHIDDAIWYMREQYKVWQGVLPNEKWIKTVLYDDISFRLILSINGHVDRTHIRNLKKLFSVFGIRYTDLERKSFFEAIKYFMIRYATMLRWLHLKMRKCI